MERVGKGISPERGEPVSETSTGEDSSIPSRTFYMATLFIFFTGGFYFAWLSIYGVNTVFFEGYPQLGTLLPGTHMSTRYGGKVYWWAVYLLTWNGLAPMALAFALVYNRIREWAQLHEFVCKWLLVLNVIVLVILTVFWIISCNTSGSGASTAANDYRYCCVFWPNAWCPNNAACTFDPPLLLTSSSQLDRNVEMTAHWAFSFVFLILNYWQITYNENLRRNYGVLVNF